MSVVSYREGHEALSFQMDITDANYADVSGGIFRLKKPDGTIVDRTATITDNDGKVRMTYDIVQEDLPLELGRYLLVGVLTLTIDGLIVKSQGLIHFEIKDEFYF